MQRFQNRPASGRRSSRRFERVPNIFSGRQGRNALFLTERAFPFSLSADKNNRNPIGMSGHRSAMTLPG
jgi:hypothetical protein